MLSIFGLAGCTGEQDQTVADLAIAYVKRPIPIVANSNPPQMVDPDVRIPTALSSGGNVYVRSSASPSATEQNITSCLTQADTVLNPNDVDGDVKDLDTSYDGTKLIFALIKPHDPANNDDINTRETWDIYEYDMAAGGCPTRIIFDDIDARKGDDLGPTYLPDTSIVFTSNRQVLVGAIQLNEGNLQFDPQDENLIQDSLVLHVMSASGNEIKQISFNQSHDLDPSVLSNGEIIFSRWDNMGSSSAINLYKIRPDGTELKALYGVHGHDVGTGGSTVQFLNPRELDDGRILGMIKPFNGSAGGGAPVLINAAQYADNAQPIWPYQNVLSGSGQINAVSLGVTTDGSISPAGRFRSVYPIRDGSNRALVSWTQCRLQLLDGSKIPCPNTIPTGSVEAFPIYGIYIYDLGSNTQLPVVIPQEDFIFDEPVVVAARPAPTILFDKAVGFGLDKTLSDENVGLLHIRSVYDFDSDFYDLDNNSIVDPVTCLGAPKNCLDVIADPSQIDADTRPARFLRVVKGAYIPEEVDPDGDGNSDPLDSTAFGVSTQQGMREILGYAPIEPDGSVLVKVPANVPFAISVVDKEGRRIGGRHQNWLQLQKGQVLQCNGCHDHSPSVPVGSPVGTLPPDPRPHGYTDEPTIVVNTGAGTSAAPFPGTNPAVLANMGETMAMTRIRTVCGAVPAGPLGLDVAIASCITLTPDINLRFTDVWTDPAAMPPPTPDFDLLYAGLGTPLLSANAASLPENAESDICQHNSGDWKGSCRIKINYEDHIHQLWVLPRTVAMVDRTCASAACHNAVGNTRVPEAHLDLSDGPSALNGDTNHFKSYSELLVADVEREADGTPVEVIIGYQDRLDVNGIPIIDPSTGLPFQDPIIINPGAPGPSMLPSGARSSYFIDKFLTGSGDPIHEDILTPAEIRLISEWLDMGAQYFNNPFHPNVPVN